MFIKQPLDQLLGYGYKRIDDGHELIRIYFGSHDLNALGQVIDGVLQLPFEYGYF
ncbi:MAG TPA: hypothetical protein VNM69_06685 [Bacillus sp. (in: firmicutes)]|nr:hypothetical protein [Bacillus sp. (in: firmicutes)]